jgi:hypothetical protein
VRLSVGVALNRSGEIGGESIAQIVGGAIASDWRDVGGEQALLERGELVGGLARLCSARHSGRRVAEIDKLVSGGGGAIGMTKERVLDLELGHGAIGSEATHWKAGSAAARANVRARRSSRGSSAC